MPTFKTKKEKAESKKVDASDQSSSQTKDRPVLSRRGTISNIFRKSKSKSDKKTKKSISDKKTHLSTNNAIADINNNNNNSNIDTNNNNSSDNTRTTNLNDFNNNPTTSLNDYDHDNRYYNNDNDYNNNDNDNNYDKDNDYNNKDNDYNNVGVNDNQYNIDSNNNNNYSVDSNNNNYSADSNDNNHTDASENTIPNAIDFIIHGSHEIRVRWKRRLGEGHFSNVSAYEIVIPDVMDEKDEKAKAEREKAEKDLLYLRKIGLVAENSNEIAVKTLKKDDEISRKLFKDEGYISHYLHTASRSLPTKRHYILAHQAKTKDGQPVILSSIKSAGSAKYYLRKLRTDLKSKQPAADTQEITIDTQNQETTPVTKNQLKDLIVLLAMIIHDVWDGMGQLHQVRVLHGDITTSNIFCEISTDTGKPTVISMLGDFGTSKLNRSKDPHNDAVKMTKDDKFQLARSDIEKVMIDEFTTQTDLFNFKVFLNELFADLGGFPFGEILDSAGEKQTALSKGNNSYSEMNLEVLQHFFNETRINLETNTATLPEVNCLLLLISKHLEQFITGWKSDYKPSDQLRYATEELLKSLESLVEKADVIAYQALEDTKQFRGIPHSNSDNNNETTKSKKEETLDIYGQTPTHVRDPEPHVYSRTPGFVPVPVADKLIDDDNNNLLTRNDDLPELIELSSQVSDTNSELGSIRKKLEDLNLQSPTFGPMIEGLTLFSTQRPTAQTEQLTFKNKTQPQSPIHNDDFSDWEHDEDHEHHRRNSIS